jgi:hypothetical protein
VIAVIAVMFSRAAIKKRKILNLNYGNITAITAITAQQVVST